MRPILAVCVVASFLLAPTAKAQTGADAVSEPPAPSISDIMARQQMRHIKLWFAGRAGNWPLADFEIDALKGGFEAVEGVFRVRGVAVEKMLRVEKNLVTTLFEKPY